jgi:hypothetical protein
VAAPVQAATPRDEVLRLVPEDVGFCLVVQDLRGQSAALRDSPFTDKFRTSAFGRRLLAAPEAQKLAEVDKVLRQNLKIGWEELRDVILGDIVVVAYRPGPSDKPEQEQGLLVLRSRDEKRLADLVERLNKVQLESGDLKKLQELRYAGRTYYHRTEKKGENYYYLHGPVLVFSTREAALRQAMDLEAQAPADREPPIAGKLRSLGADKALAALWINPRAFEPDLEAKAARALGGEATVLKTLLAYWKAVDGIALSAVLQKEEVEVRLAVGTRADQVLPGGRRLFTSLPKPSALWGRFPDDALLATAGQLDAVGLTMFVSDFLSEDARKAIREAADSKIGAVLGRDIANDVLPALGPDWGFCILAPPPQDKGWFPQMIWALRVQPSKTKPPLDQALLTALNLLASFAVLGYNQEHASTPMKLEVADQDKVEIKYLVNDKLFPPGLQPAFAFKDGHLLLASSPEAIRRFGPIGTSLPAEDEIPLIRLSLKDCRQYLNDRLEPMAAYMAQNKQITKEEASRRLHNLIEGLELFDRVEISERLIRPGQLLLTLRLRTAAPLKK